MLVALLSNLERNRVAGRPVGGLWKDKLKITHNYAYGITNHDIAIPKSDDLVKRIKDVHGICQVCRVWLGTDEVKMVLDIDQSSSRICCAG